MFRYYNYRLIESNRSYSTEKIQKLLKIHPQTIRDWINKEELQCVSQKPILIYGAILKEFIKNRNDSHKKTLNFNEMKCFKCSNISVPKDNLISIYRNKNGSIRAVGTCSNCNSEFSKMYKKNAGNELEKVFFIEPIAPTLYNTLPISTNAHIESQNLVAASESLFCEEEIRLEQLNTQISKQGQAAILEKQKIESYKVASELGSKTHINKIKTSSKTNINQGNLFDVNYDN